MKKKKSFASRLLQKLTISIERLSIRRALGEDDGGDDGGGARVKVDVRLLVTGKQEMRRLWGQSNFAIGLLSKSLQKLMLFCS